VGQIGQFSAGAETREDGASPSEPRNGSLELDPVEFEAIRGLAAVETELNARKMRVFEAILDTDRAPSGARITGFDLEKGLAHWQAS
jgi:hypothetical protein